MLATRHDRVPARGVRAVFPSSVGCAIRLPRRAGTIAARLRERQQARRMDRFGRNLDVVPTR